MPVRCHPFPIAACVAATALMTFGQLCGQTGETGRQVVAPGVVHREYTLPGPFTLDLLEVSLHDTLIRVETYRPGGLIKTTLQAAANDGERHRVVGAVNADFFSFETGWPTGNQVVNGKFVQGVSSARSHLAVSAAGRPFIERLAFKGGIRARSGAASPIGSVNTARGGAAPVFYTSYYGGSTGTDGSGRECAVEFLGDGTTAGDTLLALVSAAGAGNLAIPANGGVLSGAGGAPAEFLSGNLMIGDTVRIVLGFNRSLHALRQVIAGSGRILLQGRNVVDSMASVEGIGASFTDARHPRTFVGFNRDTTLLYLCTVDGRQASSIGMTFDDMANFLLSIGVTEAFNLDGGGSTTMVVRGAIVNSPSDPAGERSVANSLQVVCTAPTGMLHFLDVQPKRAELFQGASLQFRVSGTDAYHNPVDLPPDAVWAAEARVGTISPDGLLVAKPANDSGWVHIRWNGVVDSAFVVVRTVSGLYVYPPSLVLVPGEQVTMLVKGKDSQDRPMVLRNSALRFNAGSPSVNVSAEGQVTAMDFGGGKVTVTLDTLHVQVPYSVSERDTTITVDPMDDLFFWSFTPVNADTGQVHVTQTSEAPVLKPPGIKIAFALPVGPSSELLQCTIPLAGRPDSIALQVYGAGNADSVVLQFTDKDGERFATAGTALITWKNEWRDAGFRLNRAKPLDGASLDYPIVLTGVQIFFGSASASGGQVRATLYLDEVQAHYPARITAPQVLEDFEGDISGWQAPTSNSAAQMVGIANSLSTFSRTSARAYTGSYAGSWTFTDDPASTADWDVRITRRQNYDLGSMLRGSYIGAWVYAGGPTQTELQAVIRGGNGQICAGPRFPVRHVGWKLIGSRLEESLFSPYLTSGIITDANNKFNGFRLRGSNSDLNGQARTVIIDRLVTSALTVPTGFTAFSATWNSPLARLHWTVNSEISISRYIIERTSGGVPTDVGFLQAAGYADTTVQYEYVDTPPAGVHQYRIRQITNDGAQEVSPGVEINTLSGVDPVGAVIREFHLMQNYPNPFNPSTEIRYEVPGAGRVTLTAYDVLGREVAVLTDEHQPAGVHSVRFEAGNLASGVYMYRLQAGEHVETKSMLLLK